MDQAMKKFVIVDMKTGVLLGDSLSPLVLTIFIEDIVEYFVRHGMEWQICFIPITLYHLLDCL